MKGKERGGYSHWTRSKRGGVKVSVGAEVKKKIPARTMQTGTLRIGLDGASVDGYLVDEEESRIALGSVPFGY